MPPPPAPVPQAPPPKRTNKYDIVIPDLGSGQKVTGNGPGVDLKRRFNAPPEEAPEPTGSLASRSVPAQAEGLRAGEAAGELGMQQFAIPEVSKGLSQDDAATRFEELSRLAANKSKMGDINGALDNADKMIALQPWNAEAHLYKANLLNQARRFAEAEAAALEAVRLDPSNAESWKTLGWAQLHQKKYAEAEKTLTQAIQLLEDRRANGEDSEELRNSLAAAYAMRAFAYEGQGQRDKMIADLEHAAQLDPKRFTGHLARAKAGGHLFDPDAENSWSLLDSLPAESDSRSWSWLWALLGLAAAGGLGVALYRRAADLLLARNEKIRRNMASVFSAQTLSAPNAGDIIGDKYCLKAILGKGTAGEVWEAFDSTLNRTVAVKRMSVDLVADPEARQRRLREAHTAAGLQHPNIVTVFEVLDLPSGVFLIFEHISGQPLQRLLAKEGPLPPAQARSILASVCAALEYAHGQGVAHRNLRTSNIMLTDNGMVKVLDFAVAAGTGDASVDLRALGACLYEMLTGEPADSGAGRFQRPDSLKPSQRRPGVPPAADELVARALDPDPARRFSSAREFAAALAKL